MGGVLRVRAIEEPERTVRIDALRRGTLFHRILERFHGEWAREQPAALRPEARERMRAIAERGVRRRAGARRDRLSRRCGPPIGSR